MKEKIGERLRDLRMGVHISQTKLASILGTQQSSINRYEQGQSVPVPEIFIKYADYFDVSMDYLYCRTDDPRGKQYEFQPKILHEKAGDNKEMREFIEMCFDPKSPVNGRLKEALFQMLNEGREKT
jgi:transcriptional regulator with XRE-family HTH domain